MDNLKKDMDKPEVKETEKRCVVCNSNVDVIDFKGKQICRDCVKLAVSM